MKRIVLMTLAAGLLALGCGDSTSSGTTGAAAAGSGAAAAPLADSDVPVVADFEEEAEAKISAANYKGELDALEKEVDSTQ